MYSMYIIYFLLYIYKLYYKSIYIYIHFYDIIVHLLVIIQNNVAVLFFPIPKAWLLFEGWQSFARLSFRKHI